MLEVKGEANPGSVSDIQKECQGKKHSSGLPSQELCPLREWNNRLVPNRKRRTSRLYIVPLFI